MRLISKLLAIFFVTTLSTHCVFADEHYDKKSIMQKVRQRIDDKLANKFSVENVRYEFRNELPIVGKQIVLCYDKSDHPNVWLEFTNYEFLVNNSGANKIVTVYLGENKSDWNESLTKKTIEIFYPEAAYVFQDAAMQYWDKLEEKSKENTIVHLAQAIQAGYDALYHHFGLTKDRKIENDTPVSSLDDLLLLIETKHKEYQEDANKHITNAGEIRVCDNYRYQIRLVPSSELDRMEKLGFKAYYANPIHLRDIAQKIRPKHMEYPKYKKCADAASRAMRSLIYLEKYFSPSNNILFEKCDKYTSIMEALDRLMDEHVAMNSTLYDGQEYHLTDIRRLSVYAFRGDFKQPEEIKKSGGFLPRVLSNCMRNIGSKYGLSHETWYDCPPSMIDRDAIIAKEESWDLRKHIANGGNTEPDISIFKSTTTLFETAKFFAQSGAIYVLFVDGGLDLENVSSNHRANNRGEHELAIIGEAKWDDIAAIYLCDYPGVFFVKGYLDKTDRKNFWKIIQLSTGGLESSTVDEKVIDLTDKCTDILNLSVENYGSLDMCEKIGSLAYDCQIEDCRNMCIKLAEQYSKYDSLIRHNKQYCQKLIRHLESTLEDAPRRR